MSLFRRKKKEPEKEPKIEISKELMWDLNKKRLKIVSAVVEHGDILSASEKKRLDEEYKDILMQLFWVSFELYDYPRKYNDTRLEDRDATIADIRRFVAQSHREAREKARGRFREYSVAEEYSDIQFSIGEEVPPEPEDDIGVRRYQFQDSSDQSLEPSAFYIWKDMHKKLFKTFPNMLQWLITEQQIDHITFYKRAGIDTKLFSKIVNTPDYKPSKNTAIQCCLGLQLNNDEANMLLEAAGYSLSPVDDFDLVIQYCIENKIYNTMDVDELLYAVTQKTLTSRY